MKILLTGGSGKLGTELRKLREYVAPSHGEFDITKKGRITSFLKDLQPDLILHAAAYTDVRSPESNPQEAINCYRTNVIGTRHLVEVAECPILFISSETVLHPYNFYALTKLQAENEVRKHIEHTIVRTSFRDNPFQYAQAPIDMYTIGDNTDIIAARIDALIGLPPQGTIYVGTGVKSMYQLARRTRPDVRPCSYTDIPHPLAPMIELLALTPA
jgi:dTDP-4-dehydrorhamnose reductase